MKNVIYLFAVLIAPGIAAASTMEAPMASPAGLAPSEARRLFTLAPTSSPPADDEITIHFPGGDESVVTDMPKEYVVGTQTAMDAEFFEGQLCNVLGHTLYACSYLESEGPDLWNCMNPYKLPDSSLYFKTLDGMQYLQQRTIPYIDYSLWWDNVCSEKSALTFDAVCGGHTIDLYVMATIMCQYGG